MKFAVAASVQSNKKPVELFLIGFHSCGFLYTNRHPAEQKKKMSLPPKNQLSAANHFFSSSIFSLIQQPRQFQSWILRRTRERNQPCSVGSHAGVSDWNCTPGNGCFGFLCGKRFYSPAMELNYNEGTPQQMFGMVITGLSLCGCDENVTTCGFWQGVNVCKIRPQILKIRYPVIKKKKKQFTSLRRLES